LVATQTVIHVADLEGKTKDELIVVARDIGLENGTGLTSLRREEVLQKVMQSCSDHQGLMAGGVLELMSEGYGFLRQNVIRPGSGDVYISQSQIRRFSLRTGDAVAGLVRPPKEGER
jgi:transcription termination factor Rho